jgi:hypothetical protein
MRKTLIASLIAAAVAASPAAAQQAQTQLAAVVETNGAAAADVSETAKPAAPAVEEKKVCKRLQSSYSKRTEKVCLTEREWARVEQDG